MGKINVTKTFTKGVNRSVSKSFLGDDAARAVKGCVQREFGRLTACWEGRSVDTVNSVDSEFPALSAITDAAVREYLSGKLIAWYDLNDSAYYTLSGSDYTDIADKISAFDLATQDIDNAAQTTINSRDAGGFPGNTSYRQHASPLTTTSDARLNSFANGLSFVGVFNPANNLSALSASVIFAAVWTNGANVDSVSIGLTTANVGYITTDRNGTTSTYSLSGILSGSDSLVVFGFILATDGTLRVYKNGALAATTSLSTGALPNKTFGDFWIGDSNAVMSFGECFVGDATITQNDMLFLSEYLNSRWAAYSPTVELAEYYTGERPPWRMHYDNGSRRLLASSVAGVAGIAGSSAALYRGRGGATMMHSWGDYVFFCSDNTVMYAVHKDNLSDATETVGTGYTHIPWRSVAPEFTVAGKGIFLSLEYHDLANATFAAAGTAATGVGTVRWENGTAGNEAWHRGGNVNVTTGAGHLQISRKKTDLDRQSLPTRGYFWNANTDTALALLTAAENTQENATYRLPVPGQWAMGRFPFTYNGRFSYIEGRTYETSYLFAGSGSAVASVGANYVQISLDLSTYDIAVGDRIVLADTTIVDPILFSNAIETHTITGVEYDAAPYTRIYVDGTPTSGLENWWIQHPLTLRERRRVWHTGRPADAARNIDSREDYDPFYTHPDNYEEWGDDNDGEATATVQIGDRRAILAQERALWSLQGTAPIDGIAPAGYGAQLIRRGIGIRNDACWCFDKNRDGVYFNSPVDNRMYFMLNNTPQTIDDDVVDDPLYTGKFSHVAYQNNRVVCLDTESATPKLWIYNTVTQFWDGFTVRESCGTNALGNGTAITPGLGKVGVRANSTLYSVDQMILDSNGNVQKCTTAGTSGGSTPTWATTNGATTADGTVVWTCYKATALYDTTDGCHGGLFAPFNDENEANRFLLIYRDSDDVFAARTFIFEDDYHTDARLRHGGYIIPSNSSARGYSVRPREVKATFFERIVKDADAGSPETYNRLKIAYGESEGGDTTGSYKEPSWEDSQNETMRISWPGTTGRGNATFGCQLGDGIAPIPAVELLDIDLLVRDGRNG